MKDDPNTQGESHQLASITLLNDNYNIILPSVLLHTINTQLTLTCLFDTGALQGNYISADVATFLRERGEAVAETDTGKVSINFAGTDQCTFIFGLFVF